MTDHATPARATRSGDGLHPHTKARIQALAGMLPLILVGALVSDTGPGFLLIVMLGFWLFLLAGFAEKNWSAPTAAWREHRIMTLERQLRDAEAHLQAQADTVVIDIRTSRGSSELTRRVEAARARERLHAEPSHAELAAAEKAIASAFVPADEQ